MQPRHSPVADPGPLTLHHPTLQRLYDFWQERRNGREMPARGDFGPADLGFALGDIGLVDVLQAPLRFRYRLVGTRLVLRSGFDLTGKLANEFPDPAIRAFNIASFATVVTTRRPRAGLRDRVMNGRAWRYEVLLLPLSGDGVLVDMILFGQIFLDSAPR